MIQVCKLLVFILLAPAVMLGLYLVGIISPTARGIILDGWSDIASDIMWEIRDEY